MKEISLELVGLYFNRTEKLAVGKTNTVQEVMDLFKDKVGDVRTVGGFDYMANNSRNPMLKIRHNYKGGISRSGMCRLGGIYQLAEFESSDQKIALAWQYYVIDDAQNRVSATYIGQGFESFKTAKFAFNNGWRIIWRLVGIVREPNGMIDGVL
jgi:hypothetical protein